MKLTGWERGSGRRREEKGEGRREREVTRGSGQALELPRRGVLLRGRSVERAGTPTAPVRGPHRTRRPPAPRRGFLSQHPGCSHALGRKQGFLSPQTESGPTRASPMGPSSTHKRPSPMWGGRMSGWAIPQHGGPVHDGRSGPPEAPVTVDAPGTLLRTWLSLTHPRL